jgi:hypothetical protein
MVRLLNQNIYLIMAELETIMANAIRVTTAGSFVEQSSNLAAALALATFVTETPDLK